MIVRIPIGYGKQIRYRSATLADCGKGELLSMAGWLSLDSIAVGAKGDLAKPLARAVNAASRLLRVKDARRREA